MTTLETADPGMTQTTVEKRLNIATPVQLRQFLKAIQLKFLQIVHPRECGLLDKLYAAELLTETDHESMSGKDVNTRKDQARKLWFLLNKMSVTDFMSKVAPDLCEDFPHIIPEHYLTHVVEGAIGSNREHKKCLRCDIMRRIRAETMADTLYQHDCLTLEDYEDIASNEYDKDVVWTKMFDSCYGHDDDMMSSLAGGIQALMERYKVRVPADLAHLISSGILCTCDNSNFVLPASPAKPFSRKVGSWVRKSPFWHSPRSSGSSSVTRMDLKSYSGATSVRDDDSQSISSNNTHVPDFVTTFPADNKKIPDYTVADSGAFPEATEAVAHSFSVDDDAVSVTIEASETPVKAAMLQSAFVENPKPDLSIDGKGKVAAVYTDGNAAFSDAVENLEPQICKTDAVKPSTKISDISFFDGNFLEFARQKWYFVLFLFLITIFILGLGGLGIHYTAGGSNLGEYLESVKVVLHHHQDILEKMRSAILYQEDFSNKIRQTLLNHEERFSLIYEVLRHRRL